MVCGLLAFSAFAQNKTESLYNREVSVGASSGFLFGKSYQANLEVQADGFLNEYLGLNLALPVYQGNGFTVENVSVGPELRYPLGPIAPYVGLNANYTWNGEKLVYYARAGAEWRFNSKWGVFGEFRDNFANLNSTDAIKAGTFGVQVGLKLVF